MALTTYSITMESNRPKENIKDVIFQELGLIKKHLMEDELVKYNAGMNIIVDRWGEYLSNPKAFEL